MEETPCVASSAVDHCRSICHVVLPGIPAILAVHEVTDSQFLASLRQLSSWSCYTTAEHCLGMISSSNSTKLLRDVPVENYPEIISISGTPYSGSLMAVQ